MTEMFCHLHDANISYCVLRNYEQLPHSCGTSDLDMWVASKDAEACERIFAEVAKETKSVLASYTADQHCPKLCYLNADEGIQIDLFKGCIICKRKPMFEESDIMANTVEYNGIKVLDERFGDVMAFLKEILNNGKCNEKYTKSLDDNKSVFTSEYLKSKLAKFSSDFCDLFAETIAVGNYKEGFADLTQMGRKCLGITGSSLNLSNLTKSTRLFKPTGYTIAVLGTDGSGKSFIIDHITPILNEAFHNGIRYEHMRPNYLSSLAVASGKKKDTEEAHTVCTDPHGSKPSGLIGSIVRLSYYWLDYTWGYFRKVWLDKTFKTHIWLFDRYYYDYYVDQRRARLNLPNWIIKLYGLFVPTPDLTICLGGDPGKIYARKPETSLEEVIRQTKVLQDFARKHKKAVWVDTTTSTEKSIKAAMDAIVEMMSKRFQIKA
ncbi:hypothetical protein [Bacteroides sp.]|uniref:hypothetical protein n=1 Tax=Bacteroides sp. TaxID=29523 RepID=UPI00262AAF1C|nr:hypothetical protein [Bacteroides sp.]MDD3040469.1 hypothetical protein [Bacteroides sp.]